MDKDILKYVATKRDLDDLKDELRNEARLEHNEVLNRLDRIMTTIDRLDQERLFTFDYVKRIEGEVEKNRKDIDSIKNILKIS